MAASPWTARLGLDHVIPRAFSTGRWLSVHLPREGWPTLFVGINIGALAIKVVHLDGNRVSWRMIHHVVTQRIVSAAVW